MKKATALWILCLLVWGSTPIRAQTTKSTFVFPEVTTEFSVAFPRAPRIQTIHIEGGLTGRQAEVTTDDSLLRFEVIELNDEQASNAAKISESTRVETALAYARANGIGNPAVTAGINDLGRFAKLRGNKMIAGVSGTVESIFIWGKKQSINVTVAGMSTGYPQRSITTFLNTLKSPGQSIIPRKVTVSVSQSRLTLESSLITLPVPRSELFRILGTPTRRSSKRNIIHTWDDAGLLAYERPDSGLINQISVVFNNVDMNYDFFPRKTFSGTFIVDEKPIFGSSKSNELNIGRPRRPFSAVPALAFLREIQLGNLNITAGFASDSNYNENGKLIEISIQAVNE